MLAQICWIIIAIVDLLVNIVWHRRPWGETRSEVRIILWALGMTPLVWGGFFAEFGLPQILLWLLVAGTVVGLGSRQYFEKFNEGRYRYNAAQAILSTGLEILLLYWGGFFAGFGGL